MATDAPLRPHLLGHLAVSAASSLCAVGDRLLVVADDDTRLHAYARADLRPLGEAPLFPEALPSESRARKAAKPDLEMLTPLPDGRLLALGSGSTPRRSRGCALAVAAEGPTPLAGLWPLDCAPLYAELLRHLPELNLEGAAILDTTLYLLQRGNGAAGANALVSISLEAVLRALASGEPLTASALENIVPVALGALPGGPLGFTDACAFGDTLLFTAVAEGGGSTYEDGAFGGAALGALSRRGEVLRRFPLAGPHKIEGLCVDLNEPHGPGGPDASVALLLVADADDPTVPAPVLSVALPAGER